MEVTQLVPQERIQERIADQVVDIPLPQIMEEMLLSSTYASESYRRTDRGRLRCPDSGGNFRVDVIWHAFHLAQILRAQGRLHSARIGSMLPTTLWRKSPCEVAESVIRRLQKPTSWTGSEAELPKCGLRWSSSQLHNHAVSAHLRASTESQKSAFSDFPDLGFFELEKFKTSPVVSAHPS